MIKLLVVDDHQIVLDGLKAVLRDSNVEVVGEAEDGEKAIRKAEELQPDLIIMDIEMPKMDGIMAAKKIKAKFPAIKILICTTHSSAHKIKKGLKAGVDGYILKGSGRRQIIEAMEELMKGNNYYDQQIIEIVLGSFNKRKTLGKTELTKREKEIVVLIVDGKNTKEIAQELFLSPLTIETHRKNIFSKLGISKVTELVRYAIENDLVDL